MKQYLSWSLITQAIPLGLGLVLSLACPSFADQIEEGPVKLVENSPEDRPESRPENRDEEYCRSLKGEVVPYLLKKEDGSVDEVTLCWLGNGAIGTWTLYKFNHPWDFPHPNQPGPEASPQDRFLFSLAHNPLTLKAVVTYFSNTRYSLEAEEEASLPNRKAAPTMYNQAFEFCKAAGGKPYRIERRSNYEARVNSKKDPKLVQQELIAKIKQGAASSAPVEFKNQPFRSVCFWELNSVMDVWSLFYGPEEERNQELTDALLRRTR